MLMRPSKASRKGLCLRTRRLPDPSSAQFCAWMPSFWGLGFLMLTSVGAGAGYAGLREVLVQGGVFSDVCVVNSGISSPCVDQGYQLDYAANLGMTIMNGCAVLAGQVVDLFGARWAALGGTVAWCIFTFVSGLAAPSGLGFRVGFAGTNTVSVIVFLAVLTDFCPSSFKDPATAAKAMAVLTGLWDLAGMTYLVVSGVATALQVSSVFWIFVSYAVLTGIHRLPSCCALSHHLGSAAATRNSLRCFGAPQQSPRSESGGDGRQIHCTNRRRQG